jgi:hypothetical protein
MVKPTTLVYRISPSHICRTAVSTLISTLPRLVSHQPATTLEPYTSPKMVIESIESKKFLPATAGCRYLPAKDFDQ